MSDFDNTLFKRNHGLLRETISYLQEINLPVYIVTYRNSNQQDFILSTIGDVLPVVGIAFAESPKKQDWLRKIALIDKIKAEFEVVEVIDDDSRVANYYRK